MAETGKRAEKTGRNEMAGMGYREKLDAGADYYEIRLESIGGLGANLCGKMLGELGLKYLNLNSSSFSSYGSEKTGTPVKGYVRYCRREKEIRVHFPVTEPDLLIVFHQALLQDAAVWKGCSKKTMVIAALETGQEQMTDRCKEHDVWAVYGLEAQRIAMETHSRINVVMLGAALKVMGVEAPKVGERICKDALGNKYPEALKGNLEGLRRGYKEVHLLGNPTSKHKSEDQNKEEQNKEDPSKGHQSKEDRREVERCREEACKEERNKEDSCKENCSRENGCEENGDVHVQDWGYANAPAGGINPRAGSTVLSDLSPSRQGFIPLFIKEKCINCGLCFSTCPDMVFQFTKGEYKGREMMINQGLDYYHCKGCLRCVEICPVNALVCARESEHPKKQYFVPNRELLRMPAYYEKAGPDGYVTSESYLTEKRMEGGEI